MPQRAGHGADQLLEGTGQCRPAGNEAEPDAVARQEVSLPAVRLAETSPRSVPDHAPSEPTPHREAHGAWPGLSSPQQHERRALHAGTATEQSVELRQGPEPPLGAPPLQNFPPALRRHPLAESVRLRAPATIRLKRPLHDVLLVRARRTARPSYRCANDGVKRSARVQRVWRGCRSREARAMVGRPVPGGRRRAPAVRGVRSSRTA